MNTILRIVTGITICEGELSKKDLAQEYKQSLYCADLRDADLRGANLSDADLGGADLRGANLSGATYYKETLLKYIVVGPIGSRGDYLQVFITDTQTVIKTGCFSGGVEDFEQAFSLKDRDSKYYKEYNSVLPFITDMELTYRGGTAYELTL